MIYLIIVSYNPGAALLKTAESILSQDDTDWRLIVKDGGSTDGSVEKLRALTGSDDRIRILVSRDSGIYDAMNQAIDALDIPDTAADGASYALFLGCGDVLADSSVITHVKEAITGREYLERVEKNMETSPDKALRIIFYGDVLQMQTGQRIASNPRLDDHALYRNVPCHQACLYDVRLLKEYPFDTAWKVRSDYEQFLRMYYRGHARTVYIHLLIAGFEGGGFSETPGNLRVSEAERKKIIGMYLPADKIRRYDLIRALTLAPLRTKLANSPVTSGLYNTIKSFIYGKK